jgi:hypothetical protein
MIRNPAFSLSLFVGREPRGGVLTGSTCRARQNGITQARRMVRGNTHAQRKGALATCATLKQCTSRNLRNNTRCAPSKAQQAACGTPHCFATFPEFGGLADQTKLFPTHLADPTKLFPDAISMFGGSYKIVPQTFPTTFPEGPFQPIFPDGDLADPTKLFPDWRILQNCFPHIWRILQNCFPHIWRIRQNCSPMAPLPDGMAARSGNPRLGSRTLSNRAEPARLKTCSVTSIGRTPPACCKMTGAPTPAPKALRMSITCSTASAIHLTPFDPPIAALP